MFCDIDCTEDGSLTVYTGDWSIWFGRWDEANTSSLSQNIVFPAGQTRWLNYRMIDQIDSDNTASLTCRVNGNLAHTFASGGDPEAWEKITVAIPASYLDGQSPTVRIEWNATAPGGDIGGAMFDDVTLDCSPTSAQPNFASDHSAVPTSTRVR